MSCLCILSQGWKYVCFIYPKVPDEETGTHQRSRGRCIHQYFFKINRKLNWMILLFCLVAVVHISVSMLGCHKVQQAKVTNVIGLSWPYIFLKSWKQFKYQKLLLLVFLRERIMKCHMSFVEVHSQSTFSGLYFFFQ